MSYKIKNYAKSYCKIFIKVIKEKIERLRNELYKNIEKFGMDSNEVKKISKKLDEVASQINIMQNENEYENIVEGRSKKIIIF